MSTDQIVQKFEMNGQLFDTKAEALDFARKPKIIAALDAVTGGNTELNEYIYKNQELLESIFDCGTVQRFTKSERNQMTKALEAIKNADNKAFAFVADNADAILDSFKWPTVKRLKDDEKLQLITTSLMLATENDKALVDWIILSEAKVFACFDAGKVKREVAASATDGLIIYREKIARRKAEMEAAKLEGPEAVAKVEAAHLAEKEAERLEKEAAKAAAKK